MENKFHQFNTSIYNLYPLMAINNVKNLQSAIRLVHRKTSDPYKQLYPNLVSGNMDQHDDDRSYKIYHQVPLLLNYVPAKKYLLKDQSPKEGY